MIKSTLKNILRPIYIPLMEYITHRKINFKNIGIPKSETMRLSKLGNDKSILKETSILFGKKIHITSPYWHLHSLIEIFSDEVYKFSGTNKRPVILDCGANIGLSVIYFKKMFPEALITAFEPDRNIYESLRQNVTTFGYNDVVLENKAIWKNSDVLEFEASGALGGKIHTQNDQNTQHIIKIPAARLRDYLETPVDFLKIDIEGAEFEVLKDCADKLSNVKNLFVEYHSDPDAEQNLYEILGFIKNAGFRVYIKEAYNGMPHPFMRSDYKLHYDLQLNIFAYRF